MFYPHVVVQVVVTAGVLPEGEQGFSMAVVCCTLLGQEQCTVPEFIWGFWVIILFLKIFYHQVGA